MNMNIKSHVAQRTAAPVSSNVHRASHLGLRYHPTLQNAMRWSGLWAASAASILAEHSASDKLTQNAVRWSGLWADSAASILAEQSVPDETTQNAVRWSGLWAQSAASILAEDEAAHLA